MGLLRPFCGAAAAGISPPFRLITLGMGPFALSVSGSLPVLYTDASSGPAAAARPVNIGHVPDFAKFSFIRSAALLDMNADELLLSSINHSFND